MNINNKWSTFDVQQGLYYDYKSMLEIYNDRSIISKKDIYRNTYLDKNLKFEDEINGNFIEYDGKTEHFFY